MIIWGSRGREKDISSGQFHCPNCDTLRAYKHKRVGKYFTLYFIPLFETENLGEYVECQVCHQTYKPEVLNYKPPSPAERILMAVRRELESGMPIHMLQRKLVESGAEEQAAARLVEIATQGDEVTCPTCGFKYLGVIASCSNCGNQLASTTRPRIKALTTTSTPSYPPLQPEVRNLLIELQSDRAKHRWSTIQKLAKMQVENEAIVAALENLAHEDPVQYVRDEAQSALRTPAYQAILQRRRSF